MAHQFKYALEKLTKSSDEYVCNVLIFDNEFNCVNSVTALACQSSGPEGVCPRYIFFWGSLKISKEKFCPDNDKHVSFSTSRCFSLRQKNVVHRRKYAHEKLKNQSVNPFLMLGF